MKYYQLKDLLESIVSWLLNWDGFILVFTLLLAIFGFIIYKVITSNRRNKEYYCVEGIELIGIKVNLTKENLDVAYKIFMQLNTRKIAIPFDKRNDVIVEVYNSWYAAFTEIRSLLLDIHPCKKNNKIIKLGSEILNSEMRSHLTIWQAKFRKWYENELKNSDNDDLSPQEIQRKYPLYDELVDNLISCQSRIIKLNDELSSHFNKDK